MGAEAPGQLLHQKRLVQAVTGGGQLAAQQLDGRASGHGALAGHARQIAPVFLASMVELVAGARSIQAC